MSVCAVNLHAELWGPSYGYAVCTHCFGEVLPNKYVSFFGLLTEDDDDDKQWLCWTSVFVLVLFDKHFLSRLEHRSIVRYIRDRLFLEVFGHFLLAKCSLRRWEQADGVWVLHQQSPRCLGAVGGASRLPEEAGRLLFPVESWQSVWVTVCRVLPDTCARRR